MLLNDLKRFYQKSPITVILPVIAVSLLLTACTSSGPIINSTQVENSDDNQIVNEKNDEHPSSSESATAASQAQKAQAKLDANQQSPVKPKNSPKLSAELLFRLITAEVAGQRGKLDVAVLQYNKAAFLSNDSKIAERATRIAIFSRDNDSAFEIAQHWVSLDPNNPEVHQVLGSMYLRQGNAESAYHHFDRIISLNVDDSKKSFLLVASLLSKERDKATALSVMKKLVSNRQQNSYALYAYGQLASLVGELDTAASTLNRVLALTPKWTQAHILRSNILYRQDKKIKAHKLLILALNENPTNTKLRMYYARKLVDDKRLNEAREQIELVLDEQETNVDATFAVALLALQSGDLDYAHSKFLLLVERKQRVDEANYYLGQIAENREDPVEARRWYGVVNDGHYFIDAKIRIAFLISKQEDVETARVFLHAIQTQSTDQELRVLITEGEILRNAKMYQQAFNHYTDSLATLPDNTQLLYARALMADKLNQLEVAEDDLKNILAREPNNAQALNALGYTLADRTDRYAEALEYIERAHRLRPNDAAITDSLGWIQYRLGNTKEAVKFLTKAFKMMKDPEIAAHLGEVLWVVGEQQSAKELWDEALKATPDHELLIDVMQRFQK